MSQDVDPVARVVFGTAMTALLVLGLVVPLIAPSRLPADLVLVVFFLGLRLSWIRSGRSMARESFRQFLVRQSRD